MTHQSFWLFNKRTEIRIEDIIYKNSKVNNNFRYNTSRQCTSFQAYGQMNTEQLRSHVTITLNSFIYAHVDHLSYPKPQITTEKICYDLLPFKKGIHIDRII